MQWSIEGDYSGALLYQKMSRLVIYAKLHIYRFVIPFTHKYITCQVERKFTVQVGFCQCSYLLCVLSSEWRLDVLE